MCTNKSLVKAAQLFIACCLSLLGSAAAAQFLSASSKLLSECEFTYFYLAQLMQLRNNEGAAKAMIRRSAMMTTANFIQIEENGVIAKWKIREFTLLRDPLKREFDSGRRDPTNAAGVCDRDAVKLANQIRDTGKTLWNKTFDELQLDLFTQSRKSLGMV